MTLLLSQTVTNSVGPILRTLEARAAYDKRGEGYGVHGVELIFAVQRNSIRVDVLWMTGWMLPQNRDYRPYSFSGLGQVNWHLPVRTKEYQHETKQPCEYIGCPCFSSSGGLIAGELFDKFVADPEALWTELERYLTEFELEVSNELTARRNL